MYIPFNQLPEQSVVWIYQSSRAFSLEEQEQITQEVTHFISNWEAHSVSLHASFEIRYNRFLIIAVDGSFQKPTGCSIDESVHFIEHLQKKYNVDLLDKMNVTYRKDEMFFYCQLSDFKKLIKSKEIPPETIVFNNLVVNKYEYDNLWEVPLKDSWHSRYFK